MQAAITDSERPPPPISGVTRRPFKPTKLRTDRLYFTMEECAEILGWDVRRTRRHLVKSGAAVKRGQHYFTTKALLRRALPEESSEFIAMLDDRRDRGGD